MAAQIVIEKRVGLQERNWHSDCRRNTPDIAKDCERPVLPDLLQVLDRTKQKVLHRVRLKRITYVFSFIFTKDICGFWHTSSAK